MFALVNGSSYPLQCNEVRRKKGQQLLPSVLPIYYSGESGSKSASSDIAEHIGPRSWQATWRLSVAADTAPVVAEPHFRQRSLDRQCLGHQESRQCHPCTLTSRDMQWPRWSGGVPRYKTRDLSLYTKVRVETGKRRTML